MKKAIGFGVLAVIAVIVGAVFYLASNAEGLIKTAVQDYGSDITKTKVRLGGVTLAPTSGTGALHSFSMGNPKGFNTDSALRFAEVSMKIDYAASGPKLIRVNEIRIEKPEVTYEIGMGGSNMDAIQKNVDAFMGASGGGSSSSGEGPKIVIDHLYINSGVINVSAVALQGKALSTPLPNIHMKDIGKKKGGASPAEVAEDIIGEITKRVNVGVSALDLDAIMGTAGKVLEGAAGAAEEAVKTLGGAASDGVKGVGGVVEEGVKGVGGVIEKGAEGIGGALKGFLPGAK